MATVFALGLNATKEDVAYLAHKPGLIERSLLAAYVITPWIAVALAFVLKAPQPVEIGVLLFAISAAAPILPKKLISIGIHPRCIESLALVMAVAAVFTMPLSLVLLRPLFPKAITVSPLDVAKVVISMFLAPLMAGMLVRSFLPSLAERIRKPLMGAASIVIFGVAVLVLATHFSMLAVLGVQGFLMIVLLTLGALAVGHVMGGPDPGDRTTLALACAARFPALAMLVASQNFPDAKPLPIIAAYLVVSNLTAIPYLLWRKKRGIDEGQERPEVAA